MTRTKIVEQTMEIVMSTMAIMAIITISTSIRKHHCIIIIIVIIIIIINNNININTNIDNNITIITITNSMCITPIPE